MQAKAKAKGRRHSFISSIHMGAYLGGDVSADVGWDIVSRVIGGSLCAAAA